jgi:hypothetical protein
VPGLICSSSSLLVWPVSWVTQLTTAVMSNNIKVPWRFAWLQFSSEAISVSMCFLPSDEKLLTAAMTQPCQRSLPISNVAATVRTNYP